MKLEVKDNCPLNGFKPCKQMDCAWFIQIRGTNKNTGEEVDDWGCAIAWLPFMLIENAQMSRETGAAVESFRNEMVKANDLNRNILLEAAKTDKDVILLNSD
jgi:hypothetical protein